MAYLIPKATKKERKLLPGFTVIDLAVTGTVMFPAVFISGNFGFWLRTAFLTVTLFCVLLSTRQSRDNPGRRKFTTFVYAVRRSRRVYKSI